MSETARRLARVVVITRPTPLEQLIARYGTYAQAKSILASTGESIDWYEATHERLEHGLGRALQGIPQDRPYTRVERADLVVCGCAILDALLLEWPATRIRVAGGSW